VFDELVAVRALHFASTAMVAGGVMFRAFIGEPSFRHEAACLPPGAQAYRRQVNRMVWMSLVVSVASGTLWLLLLAKDIEQQSWQDLFSDDTVFVVLTATQFGRVWMARFVVALLLCLALLFGGTRGTARRASLTCFLASLLMGALAWSGHAGGTPGSAGGIHRGSDFLHLVAAGAWLGGLVSLALILRLARTNADPTLAKVAQTATLRFSRLGSISVGTILATGIVNTWSLVGSMQALITSQYGQLLLVKVGLFVVMVGIAAINRLRLAPMFPDAAAMGSLQRNALIEFILGLIIVVIVGALGMLPPAVHEDMHLHSH
jgi:copper resistance protein D